MAPATTINCFGTASVVPSSLTGVGVNDGSLLYYTWLYPNGSTSTSSSVSGVTIPVTDNTFSGNYSVIATFADAGCSTGMVVSSNSVTVNSANIYSITGYVAGTPVYPAFGCTSPGLIIGLTGSDTGFIYQLYNGSYPLYTVAGTGSAIIFNGGAVITAPGNYSVGTTGSCNVNMVGNVNVISSLNQYNLLGNGDTGAIACTSTGVNITLNGSDAGALYQLYNGSTPVGGIVSGTGSAISFGTQSAVGTYSVSTTNGTCSANMLGVVQVVSSIVPGVTSSGSIYCGGGPVIALSTTGAGGAGVYTWSPNIGLSATTGLNVTASPTVNTTYTVTASSFGCTGTNTVSVNYVLPPAVPSISPSLLNICVGASSQSMTATNVTSESIAGVSAYSINLTAARATGSSPVVIS